MWIRDFLTIATLLGAWSSFAEDEKFGSPIEFSSGSPATMNTSLIALLGNPSRWEGKTVAVSGYISRDLHGVLLFFSSELCLAGVQEYSVLIDTDSVAPKMTWYDLPDRRCVLAHVEGKFFEIPREKPDPKIVILRDRPAYIEAKYVRYW